MLLKTNVKAGVKVSLHSRTDFCYFSPREAALIYREELPPTEQMTRESFLVIEQIYRGTHQFFEKDNKVCWEDVKKGFWDIRHIINTILETYRMDVAHHFGTREELIRDFQNCF